MSLLTNPLLSSIGAMLTDLVHSLTTGMEMKTVLNLCHRTSPTGKVLKTPGTTVIAVLILDLSVKNLFEMKT